MPGVQQDVERIAWKTLWNEVPRIQRSVDDQKSDQDKNASQNLDSNLRGALGW
jgi:hypothetical protein